MRKIYMMLSLSLLFAFQTNAQSTVYLTTSGGSFTTEKWVNVTDGPNGTGNVIWAQGNGTYGDAQGLVTDESFVITHGVTYYINCYDRYADSWDGTTYELRTATGGGGILIANNGGASPDDGTDNDATSGWETPADELEVSEAFSFTPPSCSPPSGLGASNILPTSADLEWTDNTGGSAVGFEIELGSGGFTPTGTATHTSATSPLNVATLSASTTYDFYVRADCGGGDFSTWVGPYQFTTPCNSFSIPWSDSFETNTVGGENSIAPDCWVWENNEFVIGEDGVTTNSYNRAARTGSKFIYINWSSDDWMISPGLDLTSGNNYEFSFWVVADGVAGFDIEVGVNSSQSSTGITTLGSETDIVNGTYVQKTFYFTPPSTGTYYFGVHAIADGSPWYMSFDDFNVEQAPTCLPVTNITATTLSDTEVEIAWTDINGSTDAVIEYGPVGFTPGTGTTVNANSNPFTVSSLTAATEYDFYVSADCGGGDISTQEGPVSGLTEGTCGIYTLSLEDSWGDGWNGNRINLFVNGSLSIDTTLANGSGPMDIQFPVNVDDIISVEYINNNGIAAPNTYPGENEYTILDETASIVANEGSGGAIPGNIGNPMVPNGIQACATCPAPTAFQFEYTSQDTASVEWTAGGIETNWNIVYGTQGFVPGSGNGTTIATMTTVDTAFNLQGGSVYDFYIQADCGGNGSQYIGPISYAPPITNDAACDAIQVPVDGSTTTYINDGATLQTGEPTNLGDNTVWFMFDAPASGHVEINTCGEDFDNFIKVYEASDCSDFTTFVGVDSATNNPFMSCTGVDPAGLNLCGLTTGNTYYLAVGSENAGTTGSFPLTLTEIPNANAGTGTTSQVCAGDTVNLANAITGADAGGTWSEVDLSGGLLPGGLFSTNNLAYTNYRVEYKVENACEADSANVTVAISGPSQAGQDGTLADCNVLTDFYLFDGLSGNVYFGGTWIDVDGTGKLNGSVFSPDSLAAGTYQFDYITSNGVCPNDTSTVEVTIQDCLGTEDFTAESFKIFPNPTQGIFYIVSSVNAQDAVVEITDLQGKVISSQQMNINAGAQYDFNLSQLERGVYLIRVATENNTSVKRVVLQR